MVSCMATLEGQPKAASNAPTARRPAPARRRELLSEAAEQPNRVAVPMTGSVSAADRARGHAHGDGTDAGAGPAYDVGLRDAQERADRYLAELIEDVGEPSPQEVAEAEAWAARIESALKEARAAQCAMAEPGGVVLTSDLEDLRDLAARAQGVVVEQP